MWRSKCPFSLLVNELLIGIRNAPDRRPFEHIVPGQSSISQLLAEEKYWAEILAKEYRILFDPPPKKETEEALLQDRVD